MTSLHYLNVGRGDCTLIQHPSGRWTMVDICGGNMRRKGIGDWLAEMAFERSRGALGSPDQDLFVGPLGTASSARSGLLSEALRSPPPHSALSALADAAGRPYNLVSQVPPRRNAFAALAEAAERPGNLLAQALRTTPRQGALSSIGQALAGQQPRGNFRMDEERTNPLDYTDKLGITSIFRFVSTHPDMDHLDGLDALFNGKTVTNFWHSGVQRPEPAFGLGCPYKREDWTRYVDLTAGRVQGTTILQKRYGDPFFPYASHDAAGTGQGDQLYILAPDEALIRAAEQDDDINEASYVLGVTTSAGVVILPGDAHDRTLEHVIHAQRRYVSNCALLLAPHHGRHSERDDEFLDVLRPRLTLMGCADSDHMGYESWSRRGLNFITNNQAGNIRVDFNGAAMQVWVENESYARARCALPPQRDPNGMYSCGIF